MASASATTYGMSGLPVGDSGNASNFGVPKAINDGVSSGISLSGSAALAQQQRKQQMAGAWSAYLGQMPDSIKPEANQPDTNVKSNRCSPIVDTGVYYLFGLPVKVEVAPDTANAEKAQEWLDGCWGDEDDMMTTLGKLAMNGGVFGHVFAKIVPPNKKAGQQYPRVVVLDPQNISVVTDPDDVDVVQAYIIEYQSVARDGSAMMKRQVISRVDPDHLAGVSGGEDLDDTWSICTYARFGTGDWQQVGEPETWPHIWPPLADCQNLPVPNEHWGLPDLTPDLIQLNAVLNFVLSNINSIGLSHGHPWVWANGVDVSQIQTAPGRIIALPDIQSKLSALMAAGDIAGLMSYAADLRADMDEQSKVPGVATGRIAELPRGTMSGVALRMLYQPLLFKTTFKRRPYGKLIRELSTRMLALGGFGDGTDMNGVKVQTHWKDPLPADDLSEAQTALAWQQLGVSNATLLTQAGYDPEVEDQKNADAQAKQMTRALQGQTAPPADTPPSPTVNADGTTTAPTQTAPSTPAQPPAKPANNQPPVNHPAAIAAQQTASAVMKAAFGKAPNAK